MERENILFWRIEEENENGNRIIEDERTGSDVRVVVNSLWGSGKISSSGQIKNGIKFSPYHWLIALLSYWKSSGKTSTTKVTREVNKCRIIFEETYIPDSNIRKNGIINAERTIGFEIENCIESERDFHAGCCVGESGILPDLFVYMENWSIIIPIIWDFVKSNVEEDAEKSNESNCNYFLSREPTFEPLRSTLGIVDNFPFRFTQYSISLPSCSISTRSRSFEQSQGLSRAYVFFALSLVPFPFLLLRLACIAFAYRLISISRYFNIPIDCYLLIAINACQRQPNLDK